MCIRWFLDELSNQLFSCKILQGQILILISCWQSFFLLFFSRARFLWTAIKLRFFFLSISAFPFLTWVDRYGFVEIGLLVFLKRVALTLVFLDGASFFACVFYLN